MSYIVFNLFSNLMTIKAEVLTMDTVKDLYSNEDFRPELNKLFFGDRFWPNFYIFNFV